MVRLIRVFAVLGLAAFGAFLTVDWFRDGTPAVRAEFIDTDADSFSDLEETIVGSNPNDGNSTPEDLFYGTCEDLVDNDLDGLTDAADPGCADKDLDFFSDGLETNLGSNPNGGSSTPEDSGLDLAFGFTTCSDGVDNDGDGDTDGADAGCTPIDTDGDTYDDLTELALGSDPKNAASTPEELSVSGTCTNSMDDDLDGLTDSADPGCRERAIIHNGTVQLGVWNTGNLNVPGGTPSSGEHTTFVGLRYVSTNAEATAPGCLCEGWGAADATSGVSGYANQAVDGVVNLVPIKFLSKKSNATSVVEVEDAIGYSVLRVTHDYQPSPFTKNLYQVDVTIENISTSMVDLRYRRVMDWDVEPTAFSEFVTMNPGTATELVFTSNNGFASANPLAGPSSIGGFTGTFVDAGPDDYGALFDFDFGSLPAGESKAFRTYYGAAASEAEAKAALAAVGAEAFSLGQPNTPDGPTLGTPNTFIFAFGAVGGEPIFPTATPTITETPTVTETPTPTPTETEAPTETPTHTPTETPTPTETEAPTETPTHTPTEAGVPATDTPTPTDTPMPTETATPTETEAPTETPTRTPSETPTPTETEAPTETPTPTETEAPTETPTRTPTETPAPTETETPTETPTHTPTETPTHTPTETPTHTPTETPTPTLTRTPTPTVTPGGAVCADVTGDGVVNIFDVLAIALRLKSHDPRFDLDGNGVVTVFDVLIAASQIGTRCTR